jgi:hypothetical protein
VSKDSRIEWTNHTFNPCWGCTKVSPGCKHCYAETWAKRVGQQVWGADAAAARAHKRVLETAGYLERRGSPGRRARPSLLCVHGRRIRRSPRLR